MGISESMALKLVCFETALVSEIKPVGFPVRFANNLAMNFRSSALNMINHVFKLPDVEFIRWQLLLQALVFEIQPSSSPKD